MVFWVIASGLPKDFGGAADLKLLVSWTLFNKNFYT